MRAVLQRVREASVLVGEETVGAIGVGLLVLLGVAEGDSEDDAAFVVGKIADLRLFPEERADGGMERSLAEVNGAALVVSQFTLLGECRKGRRPSWSGAASPDDAVRLYEVVVAQLRARGIHTQTGRFRTQMQVCLVNDGPVTLLLDSKKAF